MWFCFFWKWHKSNLPIIICISRNNPSNDILILISVYSIDVKKNVLTSRRRLRKRKRFVSSWYFFVVRCFVFNEAALNHSNSICDFEFREKCWFYAKIARVFFCSFAGNHGNKMSNWLRWMVVHWVLCVCCMVVLCIY